MKTEDILNEREKTHGDFERVAKTCGELKKLIKREYAPWLSAQQILSLEIICLKMARIIHGDPNFDDHWDDIAGYAMLGKGKDEPTELKTENSTSSKMEHEPTEALDVICCRHLGRDTKMISKTISRKGYHNYHCHHCGNYVQISAHSAISKMEHEPQKYVIKVCPGCHDTITSDKETPTPLCSDCYNERRWQ